MKLLLTEAANDNDAPVWLQVATTGTYRGHPQARAQGTELVWDRSFFEKVVANFHAHPSYKAGADGLGTDRVVPYDYEHASEMSPTQGSVPQGGAPAPAWVLELSIREGENGKSELWALTSLGDKAREQIRNEEYLYTSVAIWANAIDPVSGESIGPVLSSVAFTNKPFIQGMKPMAARVEVWGDAESPEEFIVGLRQILETSENATAQELVAVLDKVYAAWKAPHQLQLPGFPEGIGFVLSQVRRLMGLDVTATAEEIVASAGQTLGAASQVPPQQANAAENPAMSEPNTTAKLASIYGVKEKEEAILFKAEEGTKALSALEQLSALFGSSDTQSLLTDAKKAIDQAEKSKPLVEALASAAGSLSAEDSQEVEKEVEKVAASNRGLDRADIRNRVLATFVCTRFGEAMRQAAEVRETQVKAEVEQIVASYFAGNADMQQRMFPVLLSQRIEAGRDAKKLEEFRKQFPVRDTSADYLRQPIVATQGGTQLAGPHTGLFSAGQSQQPVLMSQQSPQGGGGQSHPLEGYPGASQVEKARAYLCAKREGFKLLDRRDQSFQAGQYLRGGAPVL